MTTRLDLARRAVSSRTLRYLTLAALCVGCGGAEPDPDPAPDAPSVPTWQLLATKLPASLLSIWGTTTEDVWVTGGRSEITGQPTILHFDGQTWTRLASGVVGADLWWVFGFAGGDVFFTGAEGTILRYRGGSFEKMTTPRKGTIFGLWGATPNDLWAVGRGNGGLAIVWRYDGVQWSEVAIPGAIVSTAFKVSGRRADDVWISALDGLTFHWDGVALARVPSGVGEPLFSITATTDITIAVGGDTTSGVGNLVEYGTAWTLQPSIAPVAWRGVAAGAGHAFAVGEGGVVAERGARGWQLVEDRPRDLSYHSAWIDPQGGLWGVGGNFGSLPLTSGGFLTYYGLATPPEVTP